MGEQSTAGAAADALFFGTLIAIAGGWTVRLHLGFVSRFDERGFPAASKEAARWLKRLDAALAILLLLAGVLVIDRSPSGAAALGAAAVALIMASLVIEPATTKEAIRALKK